MLASNSVICTQLTLPTYDNLDDSPENSPSHQKQHSTFSSCIKVFQSPSFEKSPSDLIAIKNTLKTFKYLETDSLSLEDLETAYLELAKAIEYQHFSSGDVVFHKGDYDDRIYLVLHGTAVLFTEIAGDLFKPPTINDEVEEKIESSPSPEKVNRREPSIDENSQSALFKPTTKRLFVRQLTAMGTTGTLGSKSQILLKSPPTLQELKKISHDIHKREVMSGNGSPVGKLSIDVDSKHGKGDPEPKKVLGLYNLLIKADKTRPERYLKDGQFTFRPKKTLVTGDHFGEKASRENKAQMATVVAFGELDVISFRMETYIKLFNSQLGNWNHNTRFLEVFFRDASYPKLLKLMDLFEEGEYMQRQRVFEEKDDVDAMYLIKEGEVQLMKIMDTSKYSLKDEKICAEKIRKSCYIATVGKGEALGDDDVFFGKKRNYTAVVTSAKAVLWKMNLEVYKGISDVYRELFGSVRRAAKVKMNHRKRQVESITKQVIQTAQAEAPAKPDYKRNRPRPILKAFQDSNDSLIIPNEETRMISPASKGEIESLVKFKKEPDSPKKTKNNRDSPIRLVRGYTVVDDDERSGSSIHFGERTSASALISKFERQTTFHELMESGSKTSIGSPMHDPEKNKFRTFQVSRVLATEPEKASPEPQWETPSTKKMSKTTGLISVPNGLVPSALYKEALNHVKRKNISHTRLKEKIVETNTRMKDHKLYYDELKKSVQILSMVGNRSPTPLHDGYIPGGVSPIGRTPNGKATEVVWDPFLDRSGVNIKAILPGSLSREKTNARTDPGFGTRYIMTDERLIFKKSLARGTPVDNTVSPNMVHRIRSPKEGGMVYTELNETNKMAKSFGENGLRNHRRLNPVTSTAKSESFESGAKKRLGFRPSKVLSLNKDKN